MGSSQRAKIEILKARRLRKELSANSHTGAGGRNLLWIAAFGERGLLFVNGEFISMLGLAYRDPSG